MQWSRYDYEGQRRIYFHTLRIAIYSEMDEHENSPETGPQPDLCMTSITFKLSFAIYNMSSSFTKDDWFMKTEIKTISKNFPVQTISLSVNNPFNIDKDVKCGCTCKNWVFKMSHSCQSHNLHSSLLPQQIPTSITEEHLMLQMNVLLYINFCDSRAEKCELCYGFS